MVTIPSATLNGLKALPVSVEGTLHKGLPGFSLVGLAGDAIKESRDRVKSALLSSGFTFPPKKVTISLSPSDLQKSGSHFDLPIALAIALHDHRDYRGSEYIVFGELGLDGSLKSTASLFPLILSLSQTGMTKPLLVPEESAPLLRVIPHLTIYTVSNLSEAVALVTGTLTKDPLPTIPFDAQSLTVNNHTYYYNDTYPLDFQDIKGQMRAQRAALIAATGFHNILLEGSPGCGKSMTIKRMGHILPPLSHAELLDTARLETLDGKTPAFRALRPFRAPHHSSTRASIFGGGSRESKIGEIALAHNGLLYFDELPHYDKTILEALREPLEDHRILISRVNTKIEYPTKFLFAASQNPCPCGNLLSTTKACRCTDSEIQKYKNRLSDPFLDRIDLFVQMDEPQENDRPLTSSQQLHQDVLKAFIFRLERGQHDPNGKLPDEDLSRYCTLADDAQHLLTQGAQRFALSHRAQAKVLRVARTIADLECSMIITPPHIAEAMGYRRR